MTAISQIFILLSTGIHHSPPQGAAERAGRQECKEGTGEKANIEKKKKKPEGSPASCVKSWLFPNETRAPIVKPKSSLVATISSKKKKALLQMEKED